MGTVTKRESWQESIFRLLHQRLYPAHMDLPHRKEERSLRLFPEPQESCRKGNGEEDQVPPVGWRKYFSYQINGYLQQMGIQREFSCRYTSSRTEESVSCGSGAGNARRKEHA